MRDYVMVPREPNDDMCMAARGLIMSLSFGLPNYQTPLADVAKSGFYGEHWSGILTDEERAMTGPITKGHRAHLIYRAMIAAAPDGDMITPPEPSDAAAGAGKAVAFGEGRLVVDTGTYHDKPAVFIAPVLIAGEVGSSAKHLGHDKNSLQPGEMVLTFPTHDHAKAVADALVNAQPASTPPEPVGVTREAVELVSAVLRQSGLIEWNTQDWAVAHLAKQVLIALAKTEG